MSSTIFSPYQNAIIIIYQIFNYQTIEKKLEIVVIMRLSSSQNFFTHPPTPSYEPV